MARAVIPSFPSLQRLFFYLIILIVISIGTIALFATFIDKQITISALIDHTAKIVAAISLGIVAVVFTRHFKPMMTERIGDQAATIVQYIMVTITVLVVSFAILDTLGTSASALLTGAGIISITAGLVISTFVGSLLSGFLVFTNYKFKVGDNVIVNNIPGTIIEMTALIMRIQTDMGQVTIPNSAISSGGVILTVIRTSGVPGESRLNYNVGDRVFTPSMNEQGVVKELTPLHTVILLDSGKEVHFLNNSILAGAVVIAKITQPQSAVESKETYT